MKLHVIAVGRLKEKHFRKAADVYFERLSHYIKSAETEVREARKNERRDTAPAIAAEADNLLSAVPKNAVIVALDERGKQMSSQELAEFIDHQMVYGRQDVCFLIGGALGLDPKIRKRADKVIALSRMTLPHEMARMVLAEQLYRAMTILRGEPYHK